ncbi:GNAT family N-acetyltransferase [Chryseobacterium sp.]|uniref:GNAT family N-acetyltransferase n=1 Tax=Chryseobacterium sp. TaxID=1871047 RepID=UPI003890E5E9
MEFLHITSAVDYRVEAIYNSYSNTFPPEERRDHKQFLDLFSNDKVRVISVLNENQNIGYLVLWQLSNTTFVEHFEVFQEFRSKKLGSKITDYLFENHDKIILEIEHETLNDYAKMRYTFYQKNGFSIIDETYVQPSYGEGKPPLDLWLLANFQPEDIKALKEEIYDVVYH